MLTQIIVDYIEEELSLLTKAAGLSGTRPSCFLSRFQQPLGRHQFIALRGDTSDTVLMGNAGR